MEEVVGRQDPRTWDPEDVAFLIQKTREIDRLIDGEKAAFAAARIGRDWLTQNESFLKSYLRQLVPMGWQNTLDLVQPVNCNASCVQELRQHFPLETLLYTEEWKTAPDRRTISEEMFIERRWSETDRKAPHPDLEAVKRALADLEGNASKP